MISNQQFRIESEADMALGILARAVDPKQCPNDLADRMADMAAVHFVAAKRIAEGHHLCPGCSGLGVMTDDPQVLRCQGCGGVFTGGQAITPEQAIKFVAIHLPMVVGGEARFSPVTTFYFDLELSAGRLAGRRIHGWADTKTKRVTQWG